MDAINTIVKYTLLTSAIALSFAAQSADKPNSVNSASAGVSGSPNPQMQAVLDQLKALGGKPIETLTAEQARKQPTPADAVKALLQKQGKSTAPEPVANVQDREIPGAAGPIKVRIYTPAGAGPFPVIVYYHGGGWVIADLDTYDASPRALANSAKAIVVSAHYRQAPEHKFPAAHNDAFAAYEWTLANAQALRGDPKRVAVAGESAGGNMAAAVTLMAREKDVQMPNHQTLIYPVADTAIGSESEQENTQAAPLKTAMLPWFFDKYLRNPADGKSKLISLMQAQNLRGLPPATIITAEIDPLRSEGKAYADE